MEARDLDHLSPTIASHLIIFGAEFLTNLALAVVGGPTESLPGIYLSLTLRHRCVLPCLVVTEC